MHHALHKVVKRMGGQTTKARGARGVRGVHTFLIAKNAPKQCLCRLLPRGSTPYHFPELDVATREGGVVAWCPIQSLRHIFVCRLNKYVLLSDLWFCYCCQSLRIVKRRCKVWRWELRGRLTDSSIGTTCPYTCPVS